VKIQIRKNHGEERKSTIICEVQELRGFSMTGLLLGFLGQGRRRYVLLGGEWLFKLCLIYVHRGGWYERDLHNPTNCTYWLVVMVVMTGIWLLGLHVGKSASIYNCPDWRAFDTLCTRGRIELRNCRRRSGVICCHCHRRRRRSGMICCQYHLMAKTRDGLLPSVLYRVDIFE